MLSLALCNADMPPLSVSAALHVAYSKVTRYSLHSPSALFPININNIILLLVSAESVLQHMNQPHCPFWETASSWHAHSAYEKCVTGAQQIMLPHLGWIALPRAGQHQPTALHCDCTALHCIENPGSLIMSSFTIQYKTKLNLIYSIYR